MPDLTRMEKLYDLKRPMGMKLADISQQWRSRDTEQFMVENSLYLKL